MGREGNETGAHGESSRVNGEAGEGLELANPRRRASVADDEEDGDGVDAELLGLPGSLRT